MNETAWGKQSLTRKKELFLLPNMEEVKVIR